MNITQKYLKKRESATYHFLNVESEGEDKMLLVNHFRLIGMVYDNATYEVRKDGLKIAKFTLVIKNNPEKPHDLIYLPIFVKGNDAVLAANICRSGNRVAVNGRIETKNSFDPATGNIIAEIMFIAEDSIYLINKTNKKQIDERKIKVITEWFCPDEKDYSRKEKK